MKGLIASAAVVLLLGCASGGESPSSEIYGARFKEGKGVELSAAAKEFLNLKVTQAVEQTADDGSMFAVVPVTAVIQTVQGKFVYVVNGSHYLRTEVKPGRSLGPSIEITEGLYPGDEVVERPVDLLWYAELQALRAGASCTDEH